MNETLANIVFTNLLMQILEVNKVYKVKVLTELGNQDYNVIRDEENSIKIYEENHIGNA